MAFWVVPLSLWRDVVGGSDALLLPNTPLTATAGEPEPFVAPMLHLQYFGLSSGLIQVVYCAGPHSRSRRARGIEH